MQTTIHLVRHGEVHNPQRVFYGRLPNFGLSDRGQKQAAGAARYLAAKPLAVIYASPQQRAQETAAILAAQHPGIEIITDARLDEILVPFDGMPLHKLSSNLYKDAGPDYEQPEAIVARTQALLAQVRRECAGHEVVTHLTQKV
jgi:broad specificity phosphatase PhoE